MFYVVLFYYIFRCSIINIAAVKLNIAYLRQQNVLAAFFPALELK